jgi:DNA primase
VLADNGLVGYPKTSGSRGIHINVRIEPRWTFIEMRLEAVAPFTRDAASGAAHRDDCLAEGRTPRRFMDYNPEVPTVGSTVCG